jgi:multidrug efflux pump subunit AcrA (membrane-fusion protein)
MINISHNSTHGRIDTSELKALKAIPVNTGNRNLKRYLFSITFVILILLFLPWTQNIRSRGELTALDPSQRPQTIHSVIAGRIEKWYVQEGDFVEAGDTVMFISEIKDDYFDPNLLANTESQIEAKESSVLSYMEKVKALDSQIDAMIATQRFKTQQARNKVKQAELKIQSDSIEFVAAKNNLIVAQDQLKRFEDLFRQDLVSRTEMEGRKVILQNAQAKAIEAENKMLIAKNELLIALTELSTIENEFRDKVAKAESEKFASLSSMYDAEAQVSKLQNQYANYDRRTGFYYITAPQSGYITQAITTGVGETIKEGSQIISIMPAEYELAVQMYVEPMNLPLLQKEQKVRFIFDGWPAFIFSGWPGTSFGTFGGRIYAIDNFLSPNGKYRILVTQDPAEEPWPAALRVGGGSEGIALLNDVPIWYELWRQFNGFPPDFYKGNSPEKPTQKEEK